MLCPLMQKGSKANNVKNIFFITIGFYRLTPPLGLELPPILLPPLLLEEELLLLGLLTLVLFLFDEELEFGLTYSELERT